MSWHHQNSSKEFLPNAHILSDQTKFKLFFFCSSIVCAHDTQIALICLFFRLNSYNFLLLLLLTIHCVSKSISTHVCLADMYTGADTENLRLIQLYNWSVYDKVISRNFTSALLFFFSSFTCIIQNERKKMPVLLSCDRQQERETANKRK